MINLFFSFPKILGACRPRSYILRSHMSILTSRSSESSLQSQILLAHTCFQFSHFISMSPRYRSPSSACRAKGDGGGGGGKRAFLQAFHMLLSCVLAYRRLLRPPGVAYRLILYSHGCPWPLCRVWFHLLRTLTTRETSHTDGNSPKHRYGLVSTCLPTVSLFCGK